MSRRQVEATAPCRVDLASGAVAVNVAIDRRAWCRIETGVDGAHVESKDTLQKVSGATVAELLDREGASRVGHILSVLGFDGGVRVVTQQRVPVGSGLGGAAAEAVAVAGAAAATAGRSVDPDELWPILREAEARSGSEVTPPGDYQAALRGGVLSVRLEAGEPRVARVPVDPARIEESLLLVDGGEGAGSERGRGGSLEAGAGADRARNEGPAAVSESGQRLEAALVQDRFEDVLRTLGEEGEARPGLSPGATAPEVDRLAEIVRGAGGALRVCGGGRGRVVAVWAPPGSRGPGPREAVEKALAAAGIRAFAARVDLRGLEVG